MHFINCLIFRAIFYHLGGIEINIGGELYEINQT